MVRKNARRSLLGSSLVGNCGSEVSASGFWDGGTFDHANNEDENEESEHLPEYIVIQLQVASRSRLVCLASHKEDLYVVGSSLMSE